MRLLLTLILLSSTVQAENISLAIGGGIPYSTFGVNVTMPINEKTRILVGGSQDIVFGVTYGDKLKGVLYKGVNAHSTIGTVNLNTFGNNNGINKAEVQQYRGISAGLEYHFNHWVLGGYYNLTSERLGVDGLDKGGVTPAVLSIGYRFKFGDK